MAGSIVPSIIIGGFGLVIFLLGFKVYSNKRFLENIPTSKIRSLAMGLVEINGKAVSKKTLVSKIFKQKCVYYDYRIDREEHYRDKEGHDSTRWVRVEGKTEFVPFYLQDATGKVLIDTKGAKKDLKAVVVTKHGRDLPTGLPEKGKTSIGTGGRLSFNIGGLKIGLGTGAKYRFTEHIIAPDQTLYIIGTAGDNPNVKETTGQHNVEDIMIQKGKQMYLISEKSEKEITKWYGWGSLLLITIGMLVIGYGANIYLEFI